MQHIDDMADWDNEPTKISKTKKKKEAHALQALGETLAALPVRHLESMDLPEKLRQALIEGKSITANVAARRHRQYIGVLMRDADPEDIQRQLESRDEAPIGEPAEPSQTQVWMDRLLTFEPDAAEDFLEAFPKVERQQLRQLLRNIQKEGGKNSKSRKTLEALVLEHQPR